MKSSGATIAFAQWLKESMLKGGGKFSGEYQQGYYNGIEAIVAYIEERPELFRDENKEPMKTDVERYPEYFL